MYSNSLPIETPRAIRLTVMEYCLANSTIALAINRSIYFPRKSFDFDCYFTTTLNKFLAVFWFVWFWQFTCIFKQITNSWTGQSIFSLIVEIEEKWWFVEYLVTIRNSKKRWMLCWDEDKRLLFLMEFDRGKAIALLDKGQAIIPIWLESIHKRLK